MTLGRVALAVALLAIAAGATDPAAAQREIRVPGRPVVVLDRTLPATHLFGERVRATLTLGVNPTLADPHSVRTNVQFSPYRVVEAAGPAREEGGGRVVLRYSYLLECLERDCLPSDEAIELPDARVDYHATGAGVAEPLSVAWPELAVVSRVSERDLEQPQFRVSAPTADSSGSRAVTGALAAAALVALAGGALLARVLSREAARDAPVVISPHDATPLGTAFAVLEEPAVRTAEERRVALDSLARALERSGRHELAAR
ncbi:MAG: hypothetical protein M3304_06220, partial [Actinomycetota bacterium]|nr:hypothetical protein [Actinomycetota bacterium]